MPRGGIDGPCGGSVFSFLSNLHTFPAVTVPVYIPTKSVRGFPFFPFSPAFTLCRFFDDDHSDGCEVI